MKTLAVLLLAAMPLFADVVIPENERKPRADPPPTDTVTSTATSTSTTSAPSTNTAPVQKRARALPVVWLSVVGVTMVILIAARRRRARPVQ